MTTSNPQFRLHVRQLMFVIVLFSSTISSSFIYGQGWVEVTLEYNDGSKQNGFITLQPEANWSRGIEFTVDPKVNPRTQLLTTKELEGFYVIKQGKTFKKIPFDHNPTFQTETEYRFGKLLLSGSGELYIIYTTFTDRSDPIKKYFKEVFVLARNNKNYILTEYAQGKYTDAENLRQQAQSGIIGRNKMLLRKTWPSGLRSAYGKSCKAINSLIDKTKYKEKNIIELIQNIEKCANPSGLSFKEHFKKTIYIDGFNLSGMLFPSEASYMANTFGFGYFRDVHNMEKTPGLITNFGIYAITYGMRENVFGANRSYGVGMRSTVQALINQGKTKPYIGAGIKLELQAGDIKHITGGFDVDGVFIMGGYLGNFKCELSAENYLFLFAEEDSIPAINNFAIGLSIGWTI